MSESESPAQDSNDPEAVIDGRFQLKVSPDKLAVYMHKLQAPSGGGSPVKAAQVLIKLKKLETKYGIDTKKIDTILIALNEGRLEKTTTVATEDTRQTNSAEENSEAASQDLQVQEDASSALRIAKGDAAENGDDASLQWHVPTEKDQTHIVLPNTHIATYTPATAGKAGKNIFGKTLSAQPGRDETSIPGDGIEQKDNASKKEYSSQWYGHLSIKDKVLSIDCPIEISADKMHASMNLSPLSTNNETLESSHLIETLRQHNIIFGIKEADIAAAVKNINESQEPINHVSMAEGTAAIQSTDNGVDWHIDKEKITSNQYRIAPGTLIATNHIATEATPGTDIFGNSIPADNNQTQSNGTPTYFNAHISEDEESHKYHADTLGTLIYTRDDKGEHISIDSGITIADDAMVARLKLFNTYSDGSAVKMADIDISLRASGIKFGIDSKAIKDALASASEENIQIAQGKAAIDGVDGYIQYSRKESLGGQKLSRGRVDPHEHNSLWSFNKDDVIGINIKGIVEQDGSNVRGESIKATVNAEFQLELEGAHLDSHNKIIADIDGMLIINNSHLILTDLSVIDGDIAQKTGNIHSTTSVHVKGHVASGFILESQKTILIEKNIEDACVRAGGSIIIKGGIRGLKSEVYTPSDVSSQFIENADVFVNGDINVSGSIINSKVSSNTKITVGNKSAKHSAIIGGRITAHTTIEAYTLGSSAYRKTTLSVGFTQEEKQRQRDLKNDITNKENDLNHLDQIKNHCQSHPAPDVDKVLHKVKATQAALTNDLKTLTEQLNTVMEKVEQAGEVKIIVHKKVFPGVTIKMNDHSHEVTEETNGGSFILEDNAIIFKAS